MVQAGRSSAAGIWHKNSGTAVKAVCQGHGDFVFASALVHLDSFQFYSPVDIEGQDRCRIKLYNKRFD